MSKQNFTLLLLAVIIIAATFVFNDDSRTSSFEKQKLFPELIQHLADVKHVTVADHRGLLLEAEKSDGDWLATNKQDYPLDKESLVLLLNELAKANLDEAKTRKPENFVKLGVADIKQEDSEAILVSLNTEDKEWQILIGKAASGGIGRYIRLPEKNESWLTKAQLDLPDSDVDWLKSDILDFTEEDVESVSRIGDSEWEIIAAPSQTQNQEEANVLPDIASSKWVLANMPQSRNLKYDGILQGFVEDVLGLSFSDMQLTAPDDAVEVAKLHISLKDGDLVSCQVSRAGERYFVRFDSDNLNRYWKQWHYEITSYAGGQLVKTVDDFLEELPEEGVTESGIEQ